jgi:uncharacterized protein YaiI (UPF0178 family)
MTKIYVDADACPVKAEVIRVAQRHTLEVIYVSNSWMRLPEEWGAKLQVVDDQFDAADNWIVEQIVEGDIAITADIPLAHRVIDAGGRAVDPQGRVFTDKNIGDILATRDLLHTLRGSGEITGGPPPFKKENRSKFLQCLEQIIQELKRS